MTDVFPKSRLCECLNLYGGLIHSRGTLNAIAVHVAVPNFHWNHDESLSDRKSRISFLEREVYTVMYEYVIVSKKASN